MKKIAVIGSINTDYSFSCENLPKPSETVHGDSFSINFGGKGANEAVAISRLEHKVQLFGMIGDDLYSKENLKNLKREKVNCDAVEICAGVSGGSAGIMVSKKTNSIIVIGGANMKIDKAYIDRHKEEILKNDIFCLQLEIPFETVEYVIDLLHENNKTIIFNPSPIRKIPAKLLSKCSYVVVNEIEIQKLYGFVNEEQMLKKFNGRLILTYGSKGAYIYDDKVINIPALDIKKVTDTTGAGDTFLGAFAVALSDGMSNFDAVKFANKCAGIKTTKVGAQSGMPRPQDLEKF